MRRFIKLRNAFCLASTLVWAISCGGGSKAGSTTQGPSLSVSPTRISVSASTLSPTPSATVTINVTNISASTQELYVGYQITGQGVTSLSMGTGNATSLPLAIAFASPLSLGAGTYKNTVKLMVATDQAGTNQITNSPQSVEVTYTVTPPLAITAQASVLAGTADNLASVPNLGEGFSYSWTITGGTLTAGQGTDKISFTAGTGLSVQLDCSTSDTAGTTRSQGSLSIPVRQLPTISGFAAVVSPVGVNRASALLATFANGQGVVDNGIGSVISGVPVTTGSLSATTVYTLTVADGQDHVAKATATVTVTPGVFTAASPSLATSRASQAANLLADGRVLLSGGFRVLTGPPATYLSTGVLFEPASGTFAEVPTMLSEARGAPSSVVLPDGTVLLAGGNDVTTTISGSQTTVSSSTSAAADRFSPATGQYVSTGSLTTGRADATATLLPGGKVLIAGGVSSQTKATELGAELYAPDSGIFTRTDNPMITARVGHSAVLLANGRVLLAGGSSDAGAEIFDPATLTFSATPGSMSQPRAYGKSILLPDGRVFICGGKGSTALIAAGELFDPATGHFTLTAGSMAIPRTGFTATLIPNGKILIAGGSDSNSIPIASAECFNPMDGTFTLLGGMNVARSNHSATLLGSGKVLLAGGVASIYGITLASSEQFDPQDGAPGFPTVTYVPQVCSLTAGAVMEPLSPVSSGAILWTISPALPAGLDFSTSTGTISGTPAGPSTGTSAYVVTASNGSNSSSAFLWITIR